MVGSRFKSFFAKRGRRPGASLTLRLILLFGAVFAVLLLGLGAFISREVEHHFAEGDRVELHGKLQLTRALLAQVRSPGDLDEVPRQLDNALLGHHALAVAVVQDQGGIIFASSGAGLPWSILEGLPAAAAEYPPAQLWEQGGRVYRGLVAAARLGTPEQTPVRVVVAMDIEHHRVFMQAFERSLWLVVALALMAAGPLGWLAARRGLAPLRHMAAVARGTSAERLHQRIDAPSLPVELQPLAAEFNDMMTRLEESFRRLSDFSSDIAHELRTPISNIMTQTQVALSRARSADEYRDILSSNLEEYDRLARMTADMLFLAKADNGLLPRPAEQVSLAAEARALVEFYEALAEEQSVRLTVDGDAQVIGDRLMLRRALSNLVSNALRHTPPGGTVSIRITEAGEHARLAIENPGTSIPADQLPRLFERFRRADPARARQGEGAGLGLAITRSIMEAHGGRIDVASADGVTTFSLCLPRSA